MFSENGWGSAFRGRQPAHHNSRLKVQGLVALASVALLLAGCSGKGAPAANTNSKKGFGDVPVLMVAAASRDVPVEVQVIGNVEAYATISVKSQIGGELTKVNFHEGDFVGKGDLLFTIDRRPLQAALNQAEAMNARDVAVLAQMEANLARDSAQAKYVRAQSDRYTKLFQSGIISKDQAEQVGANADAVAQAVEADKAAINSARAAVNSSKATVENARVQLGYTEITSPIDGRTGNLNVKAGNLVPANSMELMTINQVQPIYVTFSVPEAQLGLIKQYMGKGKLPVRVRPQDDPTSSEQSGVLTFIDNSVDASTGTIKLKGTFGNADRKLWPGQFVRVTLRLTTQQNAVVVPNQAIQTGQDGSFVYVVKDDRTVESRPVKTGVRVDQDMVVEAGLAAGENVVTEGQLRLAPGSRVQLRDGKGAPGKKKRG
jgi:membrane fusion protein, multidrug efflux system